MQNDIQTPCLCCKAISDHIEKMTNDFSQRIQDSLKATDGKPDAYCQALLRAQAALIEVVQVSGLEPGVHTGELLSNCDPIERVGV